jgi:hypothetical protein
MVAVMNAGAKAMAPAAITFVDVCIKKSPFEKNSKYSDART